MNKEKTMRRVCALTVVVEWCGVRVAAVFCTGGQNGRGVRRLWCAHLVVETVIKIEL